MMTKYILEHQITPSHMQFLFNIGSYAYNDWLSVWSISIEYDNYVQYTIFTLKIYTHIITKYYLKIYSEQLTLLGILLINMYLQTFFMIINLNWY